MADRIKQVRGSWEAAAVGAAAWVLLAAAHHGPAAAANLEVFARTYDTRGPQTVCLDFFCQSTIVIPAADVVDSKSYQRVDELPGWRELMSDWLRHSAASRIGEATATAELAHHHNLGDVNLNGVAAHATMSGVFHSEARARLRTSYTVTVEFLSDASGLLGQGFLTGCFAGCPLGVDFLHHTRGDFLHSTAVPGAGARFTESLQIQQMQIAGEAFIGADPLNPGQMVHGAGGAWSANDFLPQVVGPRPGGYGAWDTVTRTGFNHFERIHGATAQFFVRGNKLSGEFNLVLDQSVEAGFGQAGAYTVGPATIAADFSHTSTFSVQRVFDPTGQVDLSGLELSVHFTEVTPVPEPGTAGLLLAGLGLAALLRRHAGQRFVSVGPVAS